MKSLQKQLNELQSLADTLLKSQKFIISHSKDESLNYLEKQTPNETLVIFKLYEDMG